MTSREYSHVSIEPSLKLLQSSAPYCVFRNRDRHQYIDELYRKNNAKDYFYEEKFAGDQVRLYLDGLSTANIPSYLLYSSLRNEFSSGTGCSIRSTVSTVTHNNTSMFTCVGGRYLDELILRDTAHCYLAGPDLKDPPGFSLPLGGGSPLMQTLHAGYSNWGQTSLVLARTRSEIFYVRTAGLDEVCCDDAAREDIPTSASMASASASASALPPAAPTILEPVQRWQLPVEISDMSCSQSGWGSACILAKNGRLFTWTPTDGVLPSFGGCRGSCSNSSSSSIPQQQQRVECSLHPQLVYLSAGPGLYACDLRAPTSAPTSAANLLYTISAAHSSSSSSGTNTSSNSNCNNGGGGGSILSITQHGSEGHTFLLSVPEAALLMDSRFLRAPVSRQYVLHGHTSTQFAPTPYGSGTGEEGAHSVILLLLLLLLLLRHDQCTV
jgi:hypothetical protein